MQRVSLVGEATWLMLKAPEPMSVPGCWGSSTVSRNGFPFCRNCLSLPTMPPCKQAR